MACPECGSWAVKADRSLSGRMVCGRCGRGLGIGAGRRRPGLGRWTGGRPTIGVLLVALLAGGALLTAAVDQLGSGRRTEPGLWPSPDMAIPRGGNR
jgi:hypothetical protein